MAQFAEPVVSFLLESISKLLIEEGKHLLGVTDNAQQLQSKLRLMLSMIKSADQRQDEDSTLREWISQSRDLAYEAENILETIAFRIASRNVLKRSICIFSEGYMQHEVGSEIVALNNKISDLTKSFHEFGIRAILEKEGPSSQQQQLIRRTYSHVEDEEDFVGLKDDIQMLAQALVKEYRVVSICGMGGLGKTTIARKVYNHPDVRRHFDYFAWVCISQQWQTRDILVRILLKLFPERKSELEKCENLDILVQELHQVLQSNKCLIVLDDIWSSSAWDCMKNAFPTRAEGSKIFLTTRNKDVAIHIGPDGFHHQLRLLSNEESWELLQKKALKGQNCQVFGDIHKFEDLGKEMVECCQGLPLAVVVLGGILSSKHDFNEWEVVRKNVRSYLKKGEIIGEEAGEVQRILALSYNDLPYKLKPCFLYLGIYPEDREIETETLYQLWMAEGMVSESDRIGEESMMDTAERYLGELAKRSMVQVEVKQRPGIRNFQSCRLHDLMRDLCLRKGEDENFLKVIDYRSRDHNDSSMGKIQRLVILLDGDDVSNYHPPKKQMVKHVRSFTLSVEGRGYYSGRLEKTRFKNFKMLRSLTVNNFDIFLDEKTIDSCCKLLRTINFSIGNLVHLRYLCLLDSAYMTLPLSNSNLQQLETLDLRMTTIMYMGDIVNGLRNLRHLYLPLDVSICWPKLHLASLTKLEILEGFRAENCHVTDLYKLTNLQVLRADNVGDYEGEILKWVLNSSQLKHLDHSFYAHDCNGGFERLFCSNVRHLCLRHFCNGTPCHHRLPKYRADFLKYLTELQLLGIGLERDAMETLEKLPKLQRLWIKDSAFVGKEMTCHAMGFPQLMFLEFHNLEYLEKWIIEERAMPCLSHLRISKCPNLKMIPDGIRFIATLIKLVIVDMSPKFNDRIQVIDGREGEDFDEVRHVASIVLR